jgi:hypothetical protein
MLDLSGENNLARLLVDDGQPGLLRSRINLEPRVGRLDIFDRSLEDDGEGGFPEDRGLALFEQPTGSHRIGGSQRPFLRVDHCNCVQDIFLSEPDRSGNVSLDNDVRAYEPSALAITQPLFNAQATVATDWLAHP